MLLDTNILIRHFTGEPEDQADDATALLASGELLMLTDVVFAECVFVLSSVYRLPPTKVAALMRVTLGHRSIEVADVPLLLRALELFAAGHGFVDSYLVAGAEATGTAVASFDRDIDRIGTVERVERV